MKEVIIEDIELMEANVSAKVYINSESNNNVLIIIHGSSGPMASEVILLKDKALERDYDRVVITDHFSKRNVSKLMYDFADENFVTYFDLADDLNAIFPFIIEWDMKVDLVGFSLGASALLVFNHSSIARAFAFYPSMRPLTESLLNMYVENLTIFVGDKDNWTPIKDILFHQEVSGREYKVKVFEDSWHGFCKANVSKSIDVFPLGECEELDNKLIDDITYREHFMKASFLTMFNIDLNKPLPKVKIVSNEKALLESFSEILKIRASRAF